MSTHLNEDSEFNEFLDEMFKSALSGANNSDLERLFNEFISSGKVDQLISKVAEKEAEMLVKNPSSVEEMEEALFSFTEKIGGDWVFNFDKFASEVAGMLEETSPEEILELEEEDYEKLLSFILASN